MLRLIPFAILSLVAVSCGSEAGTNNPEDQTDPVTSVSTTVSPEDTIDPFKLSCEFIHTIDYMREGGFEGYATPREAVESWNGETDVPDGDWVQFQGNRWMLVNEEGDTVARTEIRTMTGNASTTFATERYASDGIEYCE